MVQTLSGVVVVSAVRVMWRLRIKSIDAHRHGVLLEFHSLESLPLAPVCARFNLKAGLDSGSCCSLPFTVMRGSAGRVADDVREARPSDQGGASGDYEQALQGRRVMERVGSAVQASSHEVVYVGDAGTGPGVPSESQRAAS